MIQDIPVDTIDACRCGYKPKTYSIAYGRTPYGIHCRDCGKCLLGGQNSSERFIGLWNKYVAKVDRPDTMFGLRYHDPDNCWLRVPLIYEMGLLGLVPMGMPLNRYQDYEGKFRALPENLVGHKPFKDAVRLVRI